MSNTLLESVVKKNRARLIPFMLALYVLGDPSLVLPKFSAAYLGWIATTIGYGLWTQLIQRYSANRVAPFSLCVPVIGLSTGMLLLDEKVTPWQWAGAALVVLALVVVIWGGRLVEAKRKNHR